MMVVLAIIAIITSIALLGQSTFNRSLLLTNTAYTVALSIREMQTLGLSSRTYNSVQNAGYGVHFDKTVPQSYILFADISKTLPVPSNCVVGSIADAPDAKPGNCKYDTSGTPDGIVQTYAFSRGFTVTKFCGKLNPTTTYCSTDGLPLTSLDVAFVRANTETAVNAVRSGSSVQLTTAEIYISSADGQASRAVCVNKVGQVSVALGNCP